MRTRLTRDYYQPENVAGFSHVLPSSQYIPISQPAYAYWPEDNTYAGGVVPEIPGVPPLDFVPQDKLIYQPWNRNAVAPGGGPIFDPGWRVAVQSMGPVGVNAGWRDAVGCIRSGYGEHNCLQMYAPVPYNSDPRRRLRHSGKCSQNLFLLLLL